jgi:high-affinity nickel permease
VEGVAAVLSLAFVLGLKHATDADHIAAVTTLVSDERRSILRSCWIGVFWGAGHTLSLSVAALLLLWFKLTIPARLESGLELAVALMLVLLGARVIYRVRAGSLALHRHTHAHSPDDALLHTHWHLHSSTYPEFHSGWMHVGLRPMVVGMIHGAAGSGAIMLLALSTIRSLAEGLAYILLFGAGSIAGMLLISAFMAFPLRWARSRLKGDFRYVQVASGVFSCAFGVYMAVEIWLTGTVL